MRKRPTRQRPKRKREGKPQCIINYSMPDADYHKRLIDVDTGLAYMSASSIKATLARMLSREDTEAFSFGRTFHELTERLINGETSSIITKTEAKKLGDDIPADTFVTTPGDKVKLEAMLGTVGIYLREHPLTNPRCEVSVFIPHAVLKAFPRVDVPLEIRALYDFLVEQRISFRCRYDVLCDDRIVDWKSFSAQSGMPDHNAIYWKARNYGYLFQAALYMLSALVAGLGKREFEFVWVYKSNLSVSPIRSVVTMGSRGLRGEIEKMLPAPAYWEECLKESERVKERKTITFDIV